MNYYKKESTPLLPITEDDIAAHQLVYTETGRCIKKVYIDDKVFFIDIVGSVLNDGETLSNLTETQLDLFWRLSRTKLNNYYENTNRSKRRRIFS
jgi:hypothetical protein